MDREKFERELKERQKKHLDATINQEWKPCKHDLCEECHGTGIKKDKSGCVHYIFCDCQKCQVVFFSTEQVIYHPDSKIGQLS